jgi:hypothetical protein
MFAHDLAHNQLTKKKIFSLTDIGDELWPILRRAQVGG